MSKAKVIDIGLWYAFKKTISSSIELFISSALINTLALAVPLVIMQVYDRIIPYKGKGTLLWLVLGASLAVIIETVLKIVRDKIGVLEGARYEYRISNKCFEQILRAPLEKIEHENLNTLLENLKSVRNLQNLYYRNVYIALLDFPFAIIYIAAVWFIFPRLAYYVLWIAGGCCLLSYFVKFFYRRVRESYYEIADKRINLVIDSIKKIHFLKVFSMEEQILRQYENMQLELSHQDLKVSLINGFFKDFQFMIAQLALFGSLTIGAPLVIDGTYTVGILVTGMLLCSRGIQPILSLCGFWVKYSDIELSKKKVMAITNLAELSQRNIEMKPNEFTGEIVVENLSYFYGHSRDDVVLGINLDIKPLEIVAFTGQNLLETSALLEIISGVRATNIGKVLVGGKNVECIGEEDIGKIVHYVGLNTSILRGSILDNISCFNEENRLTAQQMADNLNLNQWLSKLAKGYNTVIERRSVSTFPSSFIYIMALARALVDNPKILIIDRIDIGLDHASKELLKSVLLELKGQCTIVIVSENVNILNLVDRIYRFEGHCAYEETKEVLSSQDHQLFTQYRGY